MEFVILARLIRAVQPDDDGVAAHGLSCLANAITILGECGLVSEIRGFGSGIVGRWKNKEWERNDGADIVDPSQAVLDSCSMIIEQCCYVGDEKIHIGIWRRGDAWINAAEYLTKVGVLKNLCRYKIEISESEHKYLSSVGITHEDRCLIDAIDANFVDRLGAWRRSYPDTEFR